MITGARRSFSLFFAITAIRNGVAAIHETLGIPPGYARACRIALQPEATDLISIGPDVYDREQRMNPRAAMGWHAMRNAASADRIELQVVSAFRSVEYQEAILRKKLDSGQCLDDILCVSAAPGYSEHHTGRALDLTTPGFAVLEEEFERSDAFTWLTENAPRFSFHMSFPRDNAHGVIYEPWHWAWIE